MPDNGRIVLSQHERLSEGFIQAANRLMQLDPSVSRRQLRKSIPQGDSEAVDGDEHAADVLCLGVKSSLGGEAVGLHRLEQIEAPQHVEVVPQAISASQLGEAMPSSAAATDVHKGTTVLDLLLSRKPAMLVTTHLNTKKKTKGRGSACWQDRMSLRRRVITLRLPCELFSASWVAAGLVHQPGRASAVEVKRPPEEHFDFVLGEFKERLALRCHGWQGAHGNGKEACERTV